MLFLQALSFSCSLVKYYITNKTSFAVHDVLSLLESGELDKVDICLKPPNDHGFHMAEDSGDEDFRGMLFITLVVYFSGRS